MTTIRKGDVVTFLPQWRSAGEERLTFVAEENEDGGRFLCRCCLPNFDIQPTEVVRVDMLETVNGQPYGGAE